MTDKDKLALCLKYFKLGGSRFFAEKYPEIIKITEDTDWDFYGPATSQAKKFLEDNGFFMTFDNQISPETNQSTGHPYEEGDDLLDSIWEDGDNDIQILLRTDVKKYHKVMNLIDGVFYADYLWKSGPNYPLRPQIQAIMNQLFRMVE